MDLKPYVGVTGVVNNTEVECVVKAFEDAGFSMETPHIPMIGYLMSNRTLSDVPPERLTTPNIKYLNFRLLRNRMKRAEGKALNMIHYATKEPATLHQQVRKMFAELYHDENLYESGLCSAIQLNIGWPESRQLGKILNDFSDLQIVLQLSEKMMEGQNPRQLASKVSNYRGLVSYALIDPSAGKGKNFNPETSVEIYNAIKERLPDLMVGFAGGFTGENVQQKVGKLISLVGNSDFCIDAEGGLRDREGDGDDLEMREVKSYLSGSGKVIK